MSVVIFTEKDKFGLKNSTGDSILKSIYDKIEDVLEDRFAVFKDGTIAIVDSEGKFLTDFDYKEVWTYRDGYLLIRKNNIMGSLVLLDLKGEEVKLNRSLLIKYYMQLNTNSSVKLPENDIDNSIFAEIGKLKKERIRDIYSISENLCLVRNYSKQFVVDTKFNIKMIPENVDEITSLEIMDTGFYMFEIKDEKYGFINKYGKVQIPAKYFLIDEFSEGLAFFQGFEREGDRDIDGYMDTTGKHVIEGRFLGAGEFKDGVAWVIDVDDSDHHYLIDTEGNYVTEPCWDIYDHGEGLYSKRPVFDEEGKYTDYYSEISVIKSNGEILFTYKPTEMKIYEFIRGKAIFEKDERYGLISDTGEILIEPIFNFDYYNRSEDTDIMIYSIKRMYGYFREDGTILTPPIYSYASKFDKNGRAVVKENIKYYILKDFGQTKKEIRIPQGVDVRMYWTMSFNGGDYFPIHTGQGSYFIDENGNQISRVYDYVSNFVQGETVVKTLDNVELVDNKGRVITDLPLELYEEILNIDSSNEV